MQVVGAAGLGSRHALHHQCRLPTTPRRHHPFTHLCPPGRPNGAELMQAIRDFHALLLQLLPWRAGLICHVVFFMLVLSGYQAVALWAIRTGRQQAGARPPRTKQPLPIWEWAARQPGAWPLASLRWLPLVGCVFRRCWSASSASWPAFLLLMITSRGQTKPAQLRVRKLLKRWATQRVVHGPPGAQRQACTPQAFRSAERLKSDARALALKSGNMASVTSLTADGAVRGDPALNGGSGAYSASS